MTAQAGHLRRQLATRWHATHVGDFMALAPYRELVAVTCELEANRWLAEALSRADQHTWLEIWRACEGLYQRSGQSNRMVITAVAHRPRERVLVATFAEAPPS